ncbi:hypothetical protein [Acinetobacter sp. WZC-1]|uniref:hypothetical protein n=1 Tax=Acinetobacter sp. WZC-1 TaxID=3459034 RepID=UPI00403E0175
MVITNWLKGDPILKDVPKSAVVGALIPTISGEAAVVAAGKTSKTIETVVGINSGIVGVGAEAIQKVKPKELPKNEQHKKEGK